MCGQQAWTGNFSCMGMEGKVTHVLEENINYTGDVLTWLKDNVKQIDSPGETEALARSAKENDYTVLIPAFSGLSALYWNDNAKAMLYGMTRTTGKNEICLYLAYKRTEAR